MPLLHWLTREADLKISQHAPYRLLETVPEHSYWRDENLPHPPPDLPLEGGGVNIAALLEEGGDKVPSPSRGGLGWG